MSPEWRLDELGHVSSNFFCLPKALPVSQATVAYDAVEEEQLAGG